MLELIYRLDLGSSAERIEGLSPSRSTITWEVSGSSQVLCAYMKTLTK